MGYNFHNFKLKTRFLTVDPFLIFWQSIKVKSQYQTLRGIT